MAGKDLGDLIAGFAPEGPLRTVVLLAYGLCAAIAPFIYWYYLGLLAQGAKPEGSHERQEYDRLRASLKEGNLAARLYAKWLTKFLDWIERFFGDAGMADRTLFPHAFGLKTSAPLWTALAFDRCLLLALIYPIATIFLIWAISGHVGPAEAALGLKVVFPGWTRGLLIGSIGFAPFLVYLSVDRMRAFLIVINAVLITAFAVLITAGVFFLRSEVSVAVAVTATTIVVFSTVAMFAGAGVPGVAAVAGLIAGAAAIAGAGAFNIFVNLYTGLIFAGVVGGAVAAASAEPVIYRSQGVFLFFFVLTMTFTCLGAADLLSRFWVTWHDGGPLLLFLGLLTLLNAPFDWVSLGLTRALLRRGLELGGWWPYLLALADACLAGIIIALLALTMVIGVQAFDELAVHGGGPMAAVLPPLGTLFDGIAKNPGAPEYWWAYALLLSTMIPSLVNLAIGGMGLTRGVPGVSRLLLHWIPEGREVPDYRRPLAALVLTGQMFAGAILGIAAQAFLALGLLYYLMPAAGLDLLWLCRQLAGLDLPGKFFRLTGVIG